VVKIAANGTIGSTRTVVEVSSIAFAYNDKKFD
jgi:hypothetical protein